MAQPVSAGSLYLQGSWFESRHAHSLSQPMALKGTEEFSILHPEVSKLFAYGDFEISLESALKLLHTLASLYPMPDSAE